LVENKNLLIATGLCHQNGRMEYWNVGILGVRAEINHFNCKKLLKTHKTITPSFHNSNCERSEQKLKKVVPVGPLYPLVCCFFVK
jgi:hypothetical protein